MIIFSNLDVLPYSSYLFGNKFSYTDTTRLVQNVGRNVLQNDYTTTTTGTYKHTDKVLLFIMLIKIFWHKLYNLRLGYTCISYRL